MRSILPYVKHKTVVAGEEIRKGNAIEKEHDERAWDE
jgi:hypothetical protein